MNSPKNIRIGYFAILREQRGLAEERVQTIAGTARELYAQLRGQYGFGLDVPQLRVVVNDAFCDWDTPLNEDDHVVFIPPVAGG